MMGDLLAGLLVVVALGVILFTIIGIGLTVGSLIYRYRNGRYVNPTKVRVCSDIKNS